MKVKTRKRALRRRATLRKPKPQSSHEEPLPDQQASAAGDDQQANAAGDEQQADAGGDQQADAAGGEENIAHEDAIDFGIDENNAINQNIANDDADLPAREMLLTDDEEWEEEKARQEDEMLGVERNMVYTKNLLFSLTKRVDFLLEYCKFYIQKQKYLQELKKKQQQQQPEDEQKALDMEAGTSSE